MKYLPFQILSVVLLAGAFILFPVASSAQQGRRHRPT